MYGCFDGYITYGFCLEDGPYRVLSDEFCDNHDIEKIPKKIIKFRAIGFVYGFICDIDKTTGNITISDSEKKKVDDLYSAIKEEVNACDLGYHLAVSTDEDLNISEQDELSDPEV